MNSRPDNRAFTIVESLISLGVASFLAIAFASLFLFYSRTSVAVGGFIAANQADFGATERLGQDIRSAETILQISTNRLVLADGSNTIHYHYDASNRTVTRSMGTNTILLLPNCWDASFGLYQADSNAQSLALRPSTSSLSRVVGIRWVSAIHTQSQDMLLITNCETFVNRQP